MLFFQVIRSIRFHRQSDVVQRPCSWWAAAPLTACLTLVSRMQLVGIVWFSLTIIGMEPLLIGTWKKWVRMRGRFQYLGQHRPHPTVMSQSPQYTWTVAPEMPVGQVTPGSLFKGILVTGQTTSNPSTLRKCVSHLFNQSLSSNLC